MKPAWPWLTKGLRRKQLLVPDCFSLLETVLVAVLLVVTTLSTYRLFQVNMQVSKFSHELDVADRELSAKMQEIREFGKTFKWCARGANPAAAYVDSDEISNNCSVGANFAGSQRYYAESAALPGFKTACNYDDDKSNSPGNKYEFLPGTYSLTGDTLLPVLVAKIKSLHNPSNNPSEYLSVEVELVEKTARRLRIYLGKLVPMGELGGFRDAYRLLYLVPEVAKWCP